MDMLNDSKNQLEKNTDKSEALHNCFRANFSVRHLKYSIFTNSLEFLILPDKELQSFVNLTSWLIWYV